MKKYFFSILLTGIYVCTTLTTSYGTKKEVQTGMIQVFKDRIKNLVTENLGKIKNKVTAPFSWENFGNALEKMGDAWKYTKNNVSRENLQNAWAYTKNTVNKDTIKSAAKSAWGTLCNLLTTTRLKTNSLIMRIVPQVVPAP